MSSEVRGHTQSWNVAKRSFKTCPAIPPMARDSGLVGKGIFLILFKDVHTEVSCGLSLQKMEVIGMRLSALKQATLTVPSGCCYDITPVCNWWLRKLKFLEVYE